MHSKKDLIGGLLVFLTTFVIFLVSPVRTVFDSKYSMLFSQQLLRHGSFSLDRQTFPELQGRDPGEVLIQGKNLTYHLVSVGGRIYSYFPSGSSVLSIPYVAFMNAIGISAVDQTGTYNPRAEVKMEVGLAALLMAGLAVMVFRTSRLVLPYDWSLLIAIATAFGTQVWSLASRALWMQTWGIFILAFVVWLLLKAEIKQLRYRPVLLATCLSWLYFVRPTFSVSIVAIALFIFLYHRSVFLPFVLTGAFWLAAFIAYSQYHFGRSLPLYYQASRLKFESLGEVLAGNVISPSRGLLIYVPVLVFIFYLLWRYRSSLVMPGLVVLGVSVIVVHLIVISSPLPPFGGHCYGPRLSTDLVPWFALLAMLAVKTRLQWREKCPEKDSAFRWRAEWALGTFLLVSSIALNGIGAMSRDAWQWNNLPVNVDDKPERIWDWQHPQFLAPFQKEG